ncbi:hypothetical protein QR680_002400 [Steinernema hermaphroditum]|uniref:Transcription factor CBF/NF-Y/archaeal histone domain-containing protein n=1 Tax=Steinernema hermaphroditum TaxID=289476 RepID=A0AA39H2K6_9BILA|nr:hypothetical protein QR680_002400 [Steinernema hermaphroditum]
MMTDDEEYSEKGMPHLSSEVENGDDEGVEPPNKKQKMILEQERFLPIANISRIMKRNLPSNGKLSKEAKECIQESVSEFISFLASEASDNCADEKRKTITAEDLLTALRNLGFDNYHEPLKEYLRKYREANKLDKGICAPASVLSPEGTLRHIEPAGHQMSPPGPTSAAPQPQNCHMKSDSSDSIHAQTHNTYEAVGGNDGNLRIAQKPTVSSEQPGTSTATATEVRSPPGFQSLPIIVDQSTGQQYITVQQPNGQQALWPVQISSSISGAPVFTVTQGQRVSSTATSEAATTSNSQMQPQQTVQSNSTAEMVPTYSTTTGMDAGFRRICFDAEDRPPPSYWKNVASSSSTSPPPPQGNSSPAPKNNVVVTADGNKVKSRIDPQEWVKAPEFVPRHRKTLAHSFGVPNEPLLGDIADPSLSFHADVPPPFTPNGNFFPEMTFGNELHMQQSVHQYQPQPMPLMKPRGLLPAMMPRPPLPGRMGMPAPPQMPLTRAAAPNLSFVPNGYTANVTSLNTGCGVAIPAIVLKKKRKRRHKKAKDMSEMLSKPETEPSEEMTREVTSTSDELSTRESSQYIGAHSSSFPDHLNTLSEEPEDESESRQLIGGSCPDLSEAQLQMWDDILFKAIVTDSEKKKTAIVEPTLNPGVQTSIMQTSICEVCPPAIFDALNEAVHADGIRSKEVRMLDKMLSGHPMEESFNETTMVDRLRQEHFRKEKVGTNDATTVKSLQKEIEDLDFKPVYSEYGYPQINNDKIQMTTFHHDTNTIDTVLVPRRQKDGGFVEDCFEGMQIRVNAFDNCDDLALSDSDCPEPSRFQQMQWALQRNSKQYVAEWLPPERVCCGIM